MSLREVWVQLQRAGILVFRAASAVDGEAIRAAFDDFCVEGETREILIRLGCGYSPEKLEPEVYASRYPFSDVDAIRALLLKLVDAGLADPMGPSFALTELGVREIRTWYERMARAMSILDLTPVTHAEVQEILEADRQIASSLAASPEALENSVLRHRLGAVLPDASDPALWQHHFQVWTIQTAREDEAERVRRECGDDWLEGFVRRQLWFVDRRPWLARARTFERLAHYVASYAPIDDAEAACREAFARLAARGEVEESAEGLRLTAEGLAACDLAESEIDEAFLARWPSWGDEQVASLHGILTRLNTRLEQLRAPNAHPKGGGP